MTIQPWCPVSAYAIGALVTHDGRTWKATSDNTGNAPDDVPGDWVVCEPTPAELNAASAAEFAVIENSFNSYEARVAAHQAAVAAAKKSAEAKLAALGLTVEELQALGL